MTQDERTDLSKLAVTNLKNNRKTYVPYILTAVLTVMMFYMMDALSRTEGLGTETMEVVLAYGRGVIVVICSDFSVLYQ